MYQWNIEKQPNQSFIANNNVGKRIEILANTQT